MFDVIQMTNPYDQPYSITESYLNNGVDPCERMYTEAVFVDGKKTMEPMVETVRQIKEVLMAQIKGQEATSDKTKGYHEIQKFDPKAFWKHELFKQLEDQFQKTFGFRSAMIQAIPEKYNHNSGKFETKAITAGVYATNRYPIEGLITDKGFCDKSNSLYLDMYMTLGLIKELEPDEIIAVILHEIGHSIDPALVDIKYTMTNIMSKYMTDRIGSINKGEQAVLDKSKNLVKKFAQKMNIKDEDRAMINLTLVICTAGLWLIPMLIGHVIKRIKESRKTEGEKLEEIRKAIQADKSMFTRQEFTEAYADNFARMYGFGAPLARAFHKMEKDINKTINSRIVKEKKRQDFIVAMTKDMLNDEHKTDIHRIRALIKEYKDDIADPKTPAKVKKQLEEDLTELEKVLDKYLNDFDDFQNKVNRLINEELKKSETKSDKK